MQIGGRQQQEAGPWEATSGREHGQLGSSTLALEYRQYAVSSSQEVEFMSGTFQSHVFVHEGTLNN